jgi:putative membrane protein (TIGR04086 family)
MEHKRGMNGRARSLPMGLAVGCGISVGLTVVLAAIVAKLIDTQTLQETAIGYAAMGILLVSSFLGSVAAGNGIKRRKRMVCCMSALCYYVVLLSLTALFFGGEYQGMVATALVVLCGGILALMVTNRKGREGARKPAHKHVYR